MRCLCSVSFFSSSSSFFFYKYYSHNISRRIQRLRVYRGFDPPCLATSCMAHFFRVFFQDLPSKKTTSQFSSLAVSHFLAPFPTTPNSTLVFTINHVQLPVLILCDIGGERWLPAFFRFLFVCGFFGVRCFCWLLLFDAVTWIQL